MRPTLGALALGWLGCAAAARTADAKVAKFSALAAKNGGVIKLDSRLYDELGSWPVGDARSHRRSRDTARLQLHRGLDSAGAAVQMRALSVSCVRLPRR